ncbi:MAG: stage II sporulation protein R [Clostridia bacterium]|nr:stage II sporulation protein R [Clostridia bacterium]
MPNTLVCLLTALQLLVSPMLSSRIPQFLHSGRWLRVHVVAADDSDSMQSLKLSVRDAVLTCYRQSRSPSRSMLQQASALLPALEAAAVQACRAEGFTGQVSVSLEMHAFSDRELHGVSVPAGEYPALMIRLGGAQGQNWWGLLDPELSLRLAAIPDVSTEGIVWDWSLSALLRALLGLPLTEGEPAV